jgi:hypothetical protein
MLVTWASISSALHHFTVKGNEQEHIKHRGLMLQVNRERTHLDRRQALGIADHLHPCNPVVRKSEMQHAEQVAARRDNNSQRALNHGDPVTLTTPQLTTAPFKSSREQPHFSPTIRIPLRSFKGLTAPTRPR